jgi:tetratricopeptide (TPR) repeat protein
LLRLSSVLRRRGGDAWRSRIPILIGAAGRARALLSLEPTNPRYWRLLGLIEWEMVPDLMHPPPNPADPWDPASGLAWARATHCFRRALEAAPEDVPTLKALAACFGVRRMSDARRWIESLATRTDQASHAFGPLEEFLGPTGISSWKDADRLAATYMHLGNPEAARRIWREAPNPPSPAVRWTRMAGADLGAFDAVNAEARCRQALNLDPRLGEAWYVLSVALFEAGHGADALESCRESVKRELTAAQRERVLGLESVLERRRLGQPTADAGVGSEDAR